jgi:hypothetical protein
MMTERIRLAGRVVLVLVVVAFAAPAAAKPQTVVIGDAVPFSSSELADAVALRAGDVSLTVHVAREGDGLKIDVGDSAQIVVVDLTDPEAAVRVVAMVVVALGTAPPALAAPGMNVAAPPPAIVVAGPSAVPAPEVSRVAIRGMVGLWRLYDREDVVPFSAAVAYRFAPMWRVAGSVTSQNRITHEPGRWLIFRLGLEALRFGPVGIEAGILQARDEGGAVPGVYIDARWYQRLSDRFRAVAGVGASWQKVELSMDSAFANEPISAYLHGGLEWRL